MPRLKPPHGLEHHPDAVRSGSLVQPAPSDTGQTHRGNRFHAVQGINLRGVLRFLEERYANEILPSQGVAITVTNR